MSFHLEFTSTANNDIAFHKKAGNKAIFVKLLLLEEISEHPFIGTGKPEPLRHALSRL